MSRYSNKYKAKENHPNTPCVPMDLWQSIQSQISHATESLFVIQSRQPINGGCINQTYKLVGDHSTYFIKVNRSSFADTFKQEAYALSVIGSTNTLRVPRPICSDSFEDSSYLVLEYIKPSGPTTRSWSLLGKKLAALHRNTSTLFGWAENNTIGASPQPNNVNDNWVDFFRTQRLEHQIKLCHSIGFRPLKIDKVLTGLEQLFTDFTPHPSLLHGDLWSGNIAFDEEGNPFTVDPASYYGDRETDIAFSEFFGGFQDEFYHAYNSAYPLALDYDKRKVLYNLYHCLNHVYLFGESYAQQVQSMIDELDSFILA